MSGVDLVTFLCARLDELERDGPGHCVGCMSGPEFAGTVYACDVDSVRAYVLADVAAKRLLLDLHEPIPSCSAGILQCDHCAELCHSGSGLSCDSPDAPYPCPTVRLLAAPFAQHPDFNPAWAVEGTVTT